MGSPPRHAGAHQRQHLAADPLGVPLGEVDADGARPDVDPRDAEVDDLAQPLRAVLGGAGDRELVDQLVGSGLARIEVDLARRAAFDARDAAARVAVHGLHRLDARPVLRVLVGDDVGGGFRLEPGETRVRHDEAANRLACAVVLRRR